MIESERRLWEECPEEMAKCAEIIREGKRGLSCRIQGAKVLERDLLRLSSSSKIRERNALLS